MLSGSVAQHPMLAPLPCTGAHRRGVSYLSFFKGHPKGLKNAFYVGNNASIHNRASGRAAILFKKHSKEIVQSIHITELGISPQPRPRGRATANSIAPPLPVRPAPNGNFYVAIKAPPAIPFVPRGGKDASKWGRGRAYYQARRGDACKHSALHVNWT